MFSITHVDIHFMGLWDSINSVGVVRDRLFPYTSSNTLVQHIRHAVSIDERRAKFKNNPFVSNRNDNSSRFRRSLNPSISPVSTPVSIAPSIHLPRGLLSSVTPRHAFGTFSRKYIKYDGDLIEMWFPGSHADVGGGGDPDARGQLLSNIPLRWMIKESAKMGLIFRPGSIQDFSTKFPSLDSIKAPAHDALCLGIKPHKNSEGCRDQESFLEACLWWTLEVFPATYYALDSNEHWHKVIMPNFGRHRTIPSDATLHWSVKCRMDLVKQYHPNLPKGLREDPEFAYTPDSVPDDLEELVE